MVCLSSWWAALFYQIWACCRTQDGRHRFLFFIDTYWGLSLVRFCSQYTSLRSFTETFEKSLFKETIASSLQLVIVCFSIAEHRPSISFSVTSVDFGCDSAENCSEIFASFISYKVALFSPYTEHLATVLPATVLSSTPAPLEICTAASVTYVML